MEKMPSFEQVSKKELDQRLEKLKITRRKEVSYEIAGDYFNLGEEYEKSRLLSEATGCFLKAAEIFSAKGAYYEAAKAYEKAEYEDEAREMRVKAKNG